MLTITRKYLVILELVTKIGQYSILLFVPLGLMADAFTVVAPAACSIPKG
jgi:hypothetical protein